MRNLKVMASTILFVFIVLISITESRSLVESNVRKYSLLRNRLKLLTNRHEREVSTLRSALNEAISDCGPGFGGIIDRLTIGLHVHEIHQEDASHKIFHPCVNDNSHFSGWGG